MEHTSSQARARAIGDARRGRASDRMASVERQLVAERADVLGRAGDRLEDAIDTWRLLIEVGAATPEQVEAALDGLTAAAYALIVTRECVGFRHDNLGWIRRHYDIPAEALRRI